MLMKSRASAAPATSMETAAEPSGGAGIKALLAESRNNLEQVRRSAQEYVPASGGAVGEVPGASESDSAGQPLQQPRQSVPESSQQKATREDDGTKPASRGVESVRSDAGLPVPSHPAVTASSSAFGSSFPRATTHVTASAAFSRPAPTPSRSDRGASGPSLGVIAASLSPKGKPENIRRVPVREKVVALTFDDGPSITKTRRLMEFLESRKTPATFFFIGKQVAQCPEIAREAERRGFELGNHTEAHVDLHRASLDVARREIDDCQNAFSAAGAAPPALIRFPYGNSTTATRGYCQSIALGMVAWDVDTRDWEPAATADKIVERVMKEAGPGSIILMHERPEATFQALPRVLDFLEREGYRVVTVGELLRTAHDER